MWLAHPRSKDVWQNIYSVVIVLCEVWGAGHTHLRRAWRVTVTPRDSGNRIAPCRNRYAPAHDTAHGPLSCQVPMPHLGPHTEYGRIRESNTRSSWGSSNLTPLVIHADGATERPTHARKTDLLPLLVHHQMPYSRRAYKKRSAILEAS